MKYLNELANNEDWEPKFDNWVKSTSDLRQSSIMPAIKAQLENQDGLDYQIDSFLQNMPKEASVDFFSKIEEKLAPQKLITFPQILRWATPIAAAAAVAFAFIQNTSSQLQIDSNIAINQPAKAEEFAVDPDLAEIFALARNLQSDTNITNIADSMDAFALFVD